MSCTRHPAENELLGGPPLTSQQLNLTHKVRSNPLPWRGQFTPQLVEAHLEAYARPGAVVFDPFVGSGTVLLESGRRGLAATGCDVNPAAIALARTYELVNLREQDRQKLLVSVERRLAPLSSRGDAGPLDLRRSLLTRWHAARGLTRLLLQTLIVMLDLQIEPLTWRRLDGVWCTLRALVEALPYSRQPLRAKLADARRPPAKPASVDLVITSPPYINVFNYHQQYRISSEALGCDVLTAARAEIGSNRKHRGNRYLTVIQYCLDMAHTFRALRRICKPSSRLILIIGRESNVRKTSFYNARIVARLATEGAGMKVVLEQERSFQNRFGALIHEDILHVQQGASAPRAWAPIARAVAREALGNARLRAPDDSLPDLEAALSALEQVQPSTMFAAGRAQKVR